MKFLPCVLVLPLVFFPYPGASRADNGLAAYLGLMVATRNYCGLSYSRNKVEAYIRKHSEAGGADFNFTFALARGMYDELLANYQAKKARGEDVAKLERGLNKLCAELARKAKSYDILE